MAGDARGSRRQRERRWRHVRAADRRPRGHANRSRAATTTTAEVTDLAVERRSGISTAPAPAMAVTVPAPPIPPEVGPAPPLATIMADELGTRGGAL
jgi:hypothetical protein